MVILAKHRLKTPFLAIFTAFLKIQTSQLLKEALTREEGRAYEKSLNPA